VRSRVPSPRGLGLLQATRALTDRGFASAANRAYLTRGGGHYIHAEKLRHTNSEAAAALARPGRYRTVAGNLRVKEVAVAPGGHGDGDDGARAQRFVVCHNPEQADRDAAVRDRLVAHLESPIVGSDGRTDRRRDEFVGSLKSKPGLRRYLRRTSGGLLRIDAAAIKREQHLDGKWLLRTSDVTLTPEDLAAAYKQLLQVERGWRDMKGALGSVGCSTTARTGSAPTSNCAGWPCCSCEWWRTPPRTPGATSDTNSTGCTWSPSPLPRVRSRYAPRPRPGRRPS